VEHLGIVPGVHGAARQIPPPAGECAGVRDDASWSREGSTYVQAFVVPTLRRPRNMGHLSTVADLGRPALTTHRVRSPAKLRGFLFMPDVLVLGGAAF